MAVNFKVKTGKTKPRPGVGETAYDRWYQAQGAGFNKTRRERYHTDAEYRKQILEAARKKRADRRKQKPEQYSVTLQGAADALDITVWTLRNWRTNEYFPEPLKFNGELWFTEAQVSLLEKIKGYLDSRAIKRLSVQQADELYTITKSIHAQWGN